MLTRSLCCFRGISAAAERRLWRAGCLDWEHLPLARSVVSPRKADDLQAQLPELQAALMGGVVDYFLRRLPVGHRVRVWPDFAAGTTFLDTETTGLGSRDHLTVIGLWRNGKGFAFVRGRNLHDFLTSWRTTTILVTFNGIRFDVPMLARTFGLTSMPPHIDLMAEARAFGYVGGLKVIEHALGVRRKPEECGDGELATRLWRRYADKGDTGSLDALLRYNARDVRSLITLARELLRRSMDGCPAPRPPFPNPVYSEHGTSPSSSRPMLGRPQAVE